MDLVVLLQVLVVPFLQSDKHSEPNEPDTWLIEVSDIWVCP